MNLFDEFTRTYIGRANHDHSDYKFLNESAWPAAAYVRKTLTNWSKDFPVDLDFVKRFRSLNDQEHLAAFFELIVFKWLQAHLFEIEIHQVAGRESQRRPDFCASKNGEKFFYAECALAPSPEQEPGIERLKNQITDILENIPCPKYWVSIDFERCNNTTLPKKKVQNFIHAMIDEGLDQHVQTDWERKSWTLAESGWQINFSLFPKSIVTNRTLGSVNGAPMGMIDSVKPLRGSLDRKRGKNYGTLEKPYIICINSSDIYLDQQSITKTLFGNHLENGSVLDVNKGVPSFFVNNGSPQNRSVSAVLMFKNILPWNMHVVETELWLNPFAINPIQSHFLNVNQISFESSENSLILREVKGGMSFRELANIDQDYMDSSVEPKD